MHNRLLVMCSYPGTHGILLDEMDRNLHILGKENGALRNICGCRIQIPVPLIVAFTIDQGGEEIFKKND